MQIRLSRTLASVILAALAVNGARADSTTGPRQWLVDYAFARAESNRLGLPLLIHFSTSWCGPCRQMERETLHAPTLMGLVGTQLIALKVDCDESPGLAEAFRVNSYPTDVIVAPSSGRIVSHTVGYQASGQYLANVNHWKTQFPNERTQAIARLTPEPAPNQPIVRSPPKSQSPSLPVIKRPEPSIASQPRPAENLVGLDGYSPVAIKTRRTWARGRRDLSAIWQGVIYYLASDKELQAFRSAPHRYAPRMLGCDPVLLWESDRAVQGNVEFGAFYDGELYLFSTAESRDRFKLNPNQYVRVRHVLNPEEVLGTRIR